MEEKTVQNVTVYDNGGNSFDRYTVIIDGDVYDMSHNPMSPQGVNQYVGREADIDCDIGQLLSNSEIPDEVYAAIEERGRI